MTNKQKIAWMVRIAVEHNVKVDRGNMIRWDDDDHNKQWRFNIKKNVIRTEVRSFDSDVWTRMGSTNIKSLSMDIWEANMKRVHDIQTGRM